MILCVTSYYVSLESPCALLFLNYFFLFLSISFYFFLNLSISFYFFLFFIVSFSFFFVFLHSNISAILQFCITAFLQFRILSLPFWTLSILQFRCFFSAILIHFYLLSTSLRSFHITDFIAFPSLFSLDFLFLLLFSSSLFSSSLLYLLSYLKLSSHL